MKRREQIDAYRTPGDDQAALARLRAAVEGACGAAPYLPLGAEYVDELRAGDVVRERELESRRSIKGLRPPHRD